jgi:hypothetical protein
MDTGMSSHAAMCFDLFLRDVSTHIDETDSVVDGLVCVAVRFMSRYADQQSDD